MASGLEAEMRRPEESSSNGHLLDSLDNSLDAFLDTS
jgi:hypothetical protein